MTSHPSGAISKEGNERSLKRFFMFFVALTVLILDGLTKFLAVECMSIGQSIKVLPDIFHITLVLNKGAAFGLFKQQKILFIIFATLVIIFIVAYVWKNKIADVALSWALGLILGGAIGNLIDRIRFGHVIDFLDFRIWPVFNLADSAITLGVAILMLDVILRKPNRARGKLHNI